MGKGFKEQVKRDLETVFYNASEHADIAQVEYNGRKYSIPIVIDHDGARDRVRSMRDDDNADGVFIADMTVYLSFFDLKIVPRKETKVKIDGMAYHIVKVGNDAGNITLDLEVLDE